MQVRTPLMGSELLLWDGWRGNEVVSSTPWLMNKALTLCPPPLTGFVFSVLVTVSQEAQD